MELCNVNNKLYLFGGSGPHAYCFNDLYTFDPSTSTWVKHDKSNMLDSENSPDPNARAGHSMTLVDCKLYIIGGSYGQEYLKDIYILDTDPCPNFQQDEDEDGKSAPTKRLHVGLFSMLNNPEFSDVTFVIEGKPFYGHKIMISQLSEKFKAMFQQGANPSGLEGSGITTGDNMQFKESKQAKIEINNISYAVFE